MKRKTNKDPHYQREAAKYERPIPSREYLLDFLAESDGPMTLPEICQALNLRDEDSIEGMRRRLSAMTRDAQLVRNRRDAYGPLEKLNLVKGRVSGHPEGFGFVITPPGDSDIFLSSRQMRRVMDGDIVIVRIAGEDRRGRKEGSLVEIVERGSTRLVGRFFTESGVQFVHPDNPRINQDIMITAGGAINAQDGQVVLVELTTWPGKNQLPAGHIVQVLGDHLAPGIEIQVAIHNYGIPSDWSPDLEKTVARMPDRVKEAECKHRFDFRNKSFITIDGEDARDFDDAIYCEPLKKGGWKLFVAIADVSHYVKVGSVLDQEAYQRGTSVYFPENVIPMLPEKISNGLCSLVPHEDRLSLVCEMHINSDGLVSDFWFMEGVIHSHARMTYTQVAQIIAQKEDDQSEIRNRFSKITPNIDVLYELYKVLRQNRERRGAIDFDTLETRILFDEQRKIKEIVPVERTDAHKLIEECMLCANVCAATLLEKSELPVLYRVHLGPSEEKLEGLRAFLGELGLGLAGGSNPSPADYQQVIEDIQDRPDADVIQTMLLRSMTQAMYQPANEGHFGLAYEAYTHFTSPIRRYPDLLVHRAIRHLILSKRRISHLRRQSAPVMKKSDIYPYDEQWIEDAGVQSSMTERRADEATRDVDNWLKCEFMLAHVGDDFDGVVSSVTSFGLFVQLNELLIEGLVHITSLPKDYYVHEASHQRLIGERTRRSFALGDALRVRVVRVNLEERKIDFELVGNAVFSNSKRTPEKQLSTPRKRLAGSASRKSNEANHFTSKKSSNNKQKSTAKKPKGIKPKGRKRVKSSTGKRRKKGSNP